MDSLEATEERWEGHEISSDPRGDNKAGICHTVGLTHECNMKSTTEILLVFFANINFSIICNNVL